MFQGPNLLLIMYNIGRPWLRPHRSKEMESFKHLLFSNKIQVIEFLQTFSHIFNNFYMKIHNLVYILYMLLCDIFIIIITCNVFLLAIYLLCIVYLKSMFKTYFKLYNFFKQKTFICHRT